MQKYVVVLGLVALLACGRGGVTQQAQNSFQAFEASAISCNGQGAAFSGNFLIAASSGSLLCDGGNPIELSEAEFTLRCTQTDTKFTCVNAVGPATNSSTSTTTTTANAPSTTVAANTNFTWSGCVNQDGTFIIGLESNGSNVVTSASQNGIANAKYLTKLNGSAKSSSQGKMMLSVIANSLVNNKTVGCLGSWPVSISRISQ